MPTKTKPPRPTYGDLLIDPDPRPAWQETAGTYIGGRAYADGADETASQMEGKWGAGRLRLLVGPELREKFDRQRYLYNQALYHGQLEDVRRESGRMVKAYETLDKVATTTHGSVVWGAYLECVVDGQVVRIVSTANEPIDGDRDGRAMTIITLDELSRLLEGAKALMAVKAQFSGSEVVQVTRTVPDPLNGLHTSKPGLDDPIPF